LDAVGTGIAVQQKLMRHTDIRTTMNLYGDVVTDEMAQANSKVAGLALNGRLNSRCGAKLLKIWRREWDSKTPANVSLTTYSAAEGSFGHTRQCKAMVTAG
jgi:hypothetical protein